jgi:hypothetical protein
MGLDMTLSLRSDEVKEGDEYKVCGEIKARSLKSKSGGVYNKFVVPVQKLGRNEKFELWTMESDAKKIVRALGRELEDYIGGILILGLEPATRVVDGVEQELRTKDGKQINNIVIRNVTAKK